LMLTTAVRPAGVGPDTSCSARRPRDQADHAFVIPIAVPAGQSGAVHRVGDLPKIEKAAARTTRAVEVPFGPAYAPFVPVAPRSGRSLTESRYKPGSLVAVQTGNLGYRPQARNTIRHRGDTIRGLKLRARRRNRALERDGPSGTATRFC